VFGCRTFETKKSYRIENEKYISGSETVKKPPDEVEIRGLHVIDRVG